MGPRWALFVALVHADLPVHCLRNEVLGDWTFHLSPPTKERSSCGHLRPDVPEKQPKLQLDKSTELRVSFLEPNVAKVDGESGYFSMVYDEGFEFKAKGNTFFAFSGFEFVMQDGQKVNQSHCEQTELGWYSNEDRSEFGCFYGKKTAGHTQALVRKESHPVAPLPPAASYFQATSRVYHERRVALLNEKATTWKAKVYDQYVGWSMDKLNTRAGLRRERKHPEGRAGKSFLALSSALQRSSELIESLPKEFDWRKGMPDGSSALEPVMDQGDCGSCYAVSTMRMLSARHRIKTGSTVPFSISFPLFCAEYNQGCSGGYGVLVSRWSQDVGLVPATCARYTTHGQCKDYESCSTHPETGKQYRANAHRYVGGYYGRANEGEMMKELKENGPFVVGVEPGDSFMYYTEGIYQSGATTPGTDGWQRVDHAVLLVGWGEEKGTKYWTIQNSWDNYWGEEGFMRIKRGDNDSGIESIPEAADVVEDEDKGQRVVSFMANAQL